MNDSTGQVLLYVLFAVAAVGAVVLSWYLGHKRREALAALARELGWLFSPDKNPSLGGYGRFDVFAQGRSRYAYNTLRGSAAIAGKSYDIQMGDYRYTTGSGKNQHTHHLSYLLATVPFPMVPDVDIRREGLFDKLAAAIGFDDIDFESAEFSSKYLVKSPHKRFAYDLVHPRMMEFLLKVEAPAIQIRDCDVLLTDGGGRWNVEGFRKKLWWAREFFELWPPHLVTQLELKDQAGGGAR
ncbi:MAG: hypothetical protein ACREN5_03740 [Gemmatimonadales bacterium]